MDTLIGELEDIREEFILKMLVVVFGLYGCPDSV